MPFQIERRTTEKASLTPSNRAGTVERRDPICFSPVRGRLGLGDHGPGAFAITQSPVPDNHVVHTTSNVEIPSVWSHPATDELTSPTCSATESFQEFHDSTMTAFNDELTLTAEVTLAPKPKRVSHPFLLWCSFIPLLTGVFVAVAFVAYQGTIRKERHGRNGSGSYFSCLDRDSSLEFSDVENYDLLVAELGVEPESPASLCTPMHKALLFVSHDYNKLSAYRRLARFVLGILFESMGGVTWSNTTGWMTSEPECDWYGIHCNDIGIVTTIDLTYNGLANSIPHEIGRLTSLEALVLPGNSIDGSLPTTIQNLRTLVRLDVRENLVGGDPLSLLVQMTWLEKIDLWNNKFSGTVPPQIGDLTALESLMISSNSMTGTIPKLIGKLTTLKILYLGGNDQDGTIPESLYKLTKLEELWIDPCNMKGQLSTKIGALTNLEELSLQPRLTGTIPSELGLLTNLKRMDFSHMDGLTGSLPATLGRLTKLSSLYLDGTHLTGTIPPELCTLVLESMSSIWAPCTLDCDNCCWQTGCEKDAQKNVFGGR